MSTSKNQSNIAVEHHQSCATSHRTTWAIASIDSHRLKIARRIYDQLYSFIMFQKPIFHIYIYTYIYMILYIYMIVYVYDYIYIHLDIIHIHVQTINLL
jgi:hypothetical protein